jgi:SAM-dependent methyltransferase
MTKREHQQRILKKIKKDSKLDPFSSKITNKENTKLCNLMNKKQVLREAEKYEWFHSIDLGYGAKTQGVCDNREFCLNQLNIIDFENKSVLDIGCRDGFYSFEAEKRGSKKVIGIDTCLSAGAVEFLIPFFDSNVEMYEEDFYTYKNSHNKTFDVVFFLGCLYHCKYPFLALKRLSELTKNGGFLLIETAMYMNDNTIPLLYCPTAGSIKQNLNAKKTYGEYAPTFFNHKALIDNLKIIGLELVNIYPDRRGSDNSIERDSFLCKKNNKLIDKKLMNYFDGGKHNRHK